MPKPPSDRSKTPRRPDGPGGGGDRRAHHHHHSQNPYDEHSVDEGLRGVLQRVYHGDVARFLLEAAEVLSGSSGRELLGSLLGPQLAVQNAANEANEKGQRARPTDDANEANERGQ